MSNSKPGTPAAAAAAGGGKYQPGDRCFVRIKGYPWWPSKIRERISGKVEAYKVNFYGTYDEGTAKPEQMMEYTQENRENLLKKPPRQAKFMQAMQEIEDNVVFENPVPETAELADEPGEEGDDDGDLLIDEKPPVLAKEKPAKTPKQTPAQKKNARAVSPDITEEKPKPAPPVRKGRGARSIGTPTTPVTAEAPVEAMKKETATPAEPSEPPQAEVVSRSGRKIKPKRFADDFDTKPETETPPANKRTKRTVSTGNKIQASEDAKPVETTHTAGKRKSVGRQASSTPQPPPLIAKTQPKATPTTALRGPPPLKGRPDPRKQLGKAKAVVQQEQELQAEDEFNDEEAPILEDESLPLENEAGDMEDEEDPSELKETHYKFNGGRLVEDLGTDEQDENEDLEEREDTSEKIPFTTKNGLEVQLRVNTNAKANIKSQKARANFEANAKKQVEKVKAELDNNSTEFLEKVVAAAGTKDEELNGFAVSRMKEDVNQKLTVLREEGEMVELVAELVSALGLKAADPDRALDLLDRIKQQKVDTTLLKKNAEIVDTIRQIRKYEGNVAEWNFTEEQKVEFEKKAELIRKKSEALYQKFKSLFCTSAPRPFPVPIPAAVTETPDESAAPVQAASGETNEEKFGEDETAQEAGETQPPAQEVMDEQAASPENEQGAPESGQDAPETSEPPSTNEDNSEPTDSPAAEAEAAE